MLQAQDLLVLIMHFCDTGRYLIKRESMHEKSVSHTRIQEFLWGEGGGGGSRPACLKTTLTFLVLNFNILHFTAIERTSGIRACSDS